MTAQLQGPANNDLDPGRHHFPQKVCQPEETFSFYKHQAAPSRIGTGLHTRNKVGSRTYYLKSSFLAGLRKKPKVANFYFLLFPTAIKENRKRTILIFGWLIIISSYFLSSYIYLTILTTEMKCLYIKALFIISQIESM